MDIKFNCSNPLCRRRIGVDESMAGKPVVCPACATALKVPDSANIKFNCTDADCGQHIVVDVSEAGRFVKCPACGKVLKVPGDPANPTFPGGAVHIREPAQSVGEPARTAFFNFIPAPFRRLLLGWGVGLVIIAGLHLYLLVFLPRSLDGLANKVFFQDIQGSPLGNNGGTELFYAQSAWDGVDIYKLDPRSLERKKVDRVNGRQGLRDFIWLGWSPYEDKLAYSSKLDGQKQQVVVLRDRHFDIIKQTFDITAVGQVEKGAWINSNSLALFGYSQMRALLNLETYGKWGGNGQKGLVPLSGLGGGKQHWLAADSEHTFAYTEDQAISEYNAVNGSILKLERFHKSCSLQVGGWRGRIWA